jgi:hypothetical protein
MALPVHRWFRFPAGYSAEWALSLLKGKRGEGGLKVLDPFAGSGTTLVAADQAGVESWGLEAQPFIWRICEGKLAWDADVRRFLGGADVMARRVDALQPSEPVVNSLTSKCFEPKVLAEIQALFEALPDDDPAVRRLLWLAVVAVIRRCSRVAAAPWQYVLPKRPRARVPSSALPEFREQVQRMAADMASLRRTTGGRSRSRVQLLDARRASKTAGRGFDLVLTSPPYLNNYDYADATRLELSVLGEVEAWADLHRYRRDLVVSCSHHFAGKPPSLSSLLSHPLLEPIREELSGVCGGLGEAKEARGGRKDYDVMTAAYFGGMAEHWRELAGILAPGAELCYVIGDSAPYGVHVPTEDWLGRLGEPLGFRPRGFEKVRDRNVRWRNRKHTVPLHEGNLWSRFDP